MVNFLASDDNDSFIRQLGTELRNSYELSDYIYRKNFHYISGSDMGPLETVDYII